MDDKYKVIFSFKFNFEKYVFEYDSLTEAIEKFNRVFDYYNNELDYVKIIWGNTEIQCYEFN